MDHNYFVYILTNKNKIVDYTGVTNDLEARLRHISRIKKINLLLLINTIATTRFILSGLNTLNMLLNAKKK